MSISKETKSKIESFAREQSPYYLEEAEMTYIEKLQRKTSQTKDKAAQKLARFKNQSEKGKEAEDDMMLYMTDYISDLVARGMSEEEAFEKAEADLKKDSGSIYSSALQDKFEQYYEEMPIQVQQAAGLYYGGFVIIGLIVGAVVGFFIGMNMFTVAFWIPSLVGAVLGLLLGVGFGLVKHANIVRNMES